ncbi:MAG: biotin--[acetyl-CoA-carboxylase] ligase [Polaromonas sp.]|uniref:biotin--[acetyl-CoA-carboxylase] ligase n=1 Tax=Polaromonas sp. TaxID=1869339 RepID=UPI00272F0670|nr:biotin--[acetyl-CoA-carboxylase] ligase [Polaromonas sp.]MDP2451606.1 biotin--[acetyl-CoA-carboxylase] ligase [Polaromonas sp.]MDP3248320.1 biotin--[acetyl-CoA-carboxylase] ligase [Polaromonas sp.]MDP3755112.1 biotin--[acetyl-CoA-carboxylase] ligase [Polaromonas sp.]
MSTPPTPPIRWPAETIWEAVAPVLPGFTVEVLPQIDSTNTELMRRFRSAGPDACGPVLLVAEQQTAGRGRMGRSWQSSAGDSLTFSLGLPLQPADWSGLSLAVGISIAESLESGNPAAPAIRLKWPNDLWLSDARGESKLAGILVETASWGEQRYVVIGVGINVRTMAQPLAPAGTGQPAALAPGALQTLLPGIDVAQTLLRVAAPLVQAVQAFGLFGFAPFQARFAARDALAGRAVQLSDGTQGVAHGVGENGALLVHTAAGMKEITSSEVSVRPVTPPTAGSARPC